MASKFDYDVFYGEDECLIGVSKERYTEEQAFEIAKEQLETDNVELVDEWLYVYYGFGTNYDGENYHGRWLVRDKPKRGCPVWVFREKGA